MAEVVKISSNSSHISHRPASGRPLKWLPVPTLRLQRSGRDQPSVFRPARCRCPVARSGRVMLRETRRAIRYHHPLPNLKLMPARRMFSLSETVVLVPPQLVKPQDALARSTNRYRPWRSMRLPAPRSDLGDQADLKDFAPSPSRVGHLPQRCRSLKKNW